MMSSVRRLRVNAPIALLLLAGMLALSHPAAASGQAVASAPACEQKIGQMRFYKDFRGVECRIEWAN